MDTLCIMDNVRENRISDTCTVEAVYIVFHANGLVKGMNSSHPLRPDI